jgi:flagellar hook-basal body complex protein FliE
MEQSMARVNDLQQEADRMTQRLALGDVDDISDVVIATSQAELALRMMVEVRNKLVDAYQQISRMPV